MSAAKKTCPMDETRAVLAAHAARYPHMTAQDAVKLLYQNEFGPGHLVRDPAAARVRLEQEWRTVEHDPTAPPFENIGNGLVRVNLTAWDFQQYPLESLADDFIRSAASHQGSMDRFLKKIDLLRDLTKQGVFSFSSEDLEEYLEDYINRGCPMVSHSDIYRDEYRPAYRVVRRNCLSLPPMTVILKEISFRRKFSSPLLVAIEGRCASGKSTLAARLQQELGCPVIHMDDFFLRPKQRTSQRYATPGGNVDHERFLKEVLRPLHRGKAIRYRPFSCSTQTLGDPIRVTPAPVVVVEGSYSCHPALRRFYHLRLFLNVSPEEQEKRILLRDGAEYAAVFREKWIPLEEAYFSACRVEECCQFSFAYGSDSSEAWDS